MFYFCNRGKNKNLTSGIGAKKLFKEYITNSWCKKQKENKYNEHHMITDNLSSGDIVLQLLLYSKRSECCLQKQILTVYGYFNVWK